MEGHILGGNFPLEISEALLSTSSHLIQHIKFSIVIYYYKLYIFVEFGGELASLMIESQDFSVPHM